MKRESEKAGMYFNIKKTKVMTTEEWTSLEVDGVEIELVSSSCFIGAMIESQGGCEKEIRRRVTLGRFATQVIAKIWKNRKVNKLT